MFIIQTKFYHINNTIKKWEMGKTKYLINRNSNNNNNCLWHENCKKGTIVYFKRITSEMNILRINSFLPLLVIIGFMAIIMVAKGSSLKREKPGLMATQFHNELNSYFMADKIRMRRQLGDIPAPPDFPPPPGL